MLSVALGVAVYLAIQIANHSANRAFSATVDLVAGKADLLVSAPGGSLPETTFPAVAQAEGVARATPVVRGFVTLPDYPGEYLQVLGVDVFTDSQFRTFELAEFNGGQLDVQRWLGDGDAIAISEEFARAHQLKAGDSVRAQVNGADRQLRIGFVLRTSGGTAIDPHFAAMDIGWAQELFGMRGTLSEIQLQLADGEQRKEVVDRLRSILPADASVASPAQRGEQVENMLGGFQLNLTAMSLVSLLVGMFLIYNTVSASVVRRRREIGILRSLGVTRNEVRALFLGEAVAVGGVGVVVGIAGGLLLARLLIGTVSQTISSLYVLLSVRDVATAPWMFASAGVLGLISVGVAAWLPAATAARMHPVRALHGWDMVEEAHHLSHGWWVAGVLAIALAGVCSVLALSIGPPWVGFGAAFCVLAGFSLLVPSVTGTFSAVAAGLLRRGMHTLRRPFVEPQLAVGNLSRALGRNAITIAALASAVAMTIGVSVMVFSFRQTVESWIAQTLVADMFIAPASNELVGPVSFIPPEAIRFLETNAAVAAVDTFREIDVAMGAKKIAVAVIRGSERRRLRFVRGDETNILRRFYGEQSVLVSESFARKHHVGDGGKVELITPDGACEFAIAGTFYDYTRDEGVVYMSEQTFTRLWKDTRVSSLAVYLKANSSADELTAAFRQEFSRTGQFLILSNRELRTRIFEIFDQTFAVTYVLRTIAVLVAVVGICLTLTTLITERSRDLGILRAIGASVVQLRKLLLWESAMIGLLAALIGVASGICLSVVLTGVINRAFFGWTIQLAFPWRSLAFTPLWIVGASVAAGLLPAWR
ncbi:MAG TPA: FtsX-like permease family protein, partial [Chthoniobacterales bacterium]|nr:FtsX-like permease family protein [Chthoniobacterales bacterium]